MNIESLGRVGQADREGEIVCTKYIIQREGERGGYIDRGRERGGERERGRERQRERERGRQRKIELLTKLKRGNKQDNASC